MTELQELTLAWIEALVDLLPVGYAFGAGMVSTVNPCGFAMLPAYLAFYLGTGDARFYERAEIKDVVAYLSVLNNTDDAVALMRIANRPRRGIGDTSIQRMVAHATALGISLWDATADPEAAGVATASARAIRGFRTMMETLMSAAQELEVDELVQAVLERSGTIEAYEAERTIEARGRIENLEELVGSAQEYRRRADEPSLAGFLEEVQLQSDQDTLASDEAQVTLMTIHNAKGLEYRVVFLIGMEEGIFPHARSIEDNEVEEERRLAYVGMTRARDRLILTRAGLRDGRGTGGSLFLREAGLEPVPAG